MGNSSPAKSVLSRAGGYIAGILSVAAVALIRQALDPILHEDAPLLIFALPVIVAAAFGGLYPGLFATLLGMLAGSYLFVEPRGSLLVWSDLNIVRLLLFVVQGVAISFIVERVHKSRRRILAGERALRESESRYRAFFEMVSVGAAQVDAVTGRFLDFNEAFRGMIGYSREELLARTFSDITHPEDRALDLEKYQRFRTGEVPAYWTEKRYLRNDGDVIWVRLDVAGVRSPSGELLRSVGVIHDITERKRAEAELARQKEAAEAERHRLRAVLDVLPVAVFITDAGGKVRETNPAAAEVWGGEPLLSGVPEYGEDYKGWWPGTGRRMESHEWGMARALATGERVIAEEVEIETRDGRRKSILNYSLCIRDEHGRITGGVTVNVDITERKRAEEALRQSEQRLRATFDNAGVGIAEADHTGRIVVANDRFCMISARSREELLGMTVNDLTHPDDREKTRLYISDLIEGRTRRFADEKRYVRPDGSAVWVRFTASSVCDGGGHCTRIIAVVEDITARKRAEEALQESEERLRLAIESTGLGTFDFYPPSGKLVWNRFTYDHFGLPPDAEVGYQVFLSRIHPDDRERVERVVSEALRPESGGGYAADFRILNAATGQERWLSSWGRVHFDRENRPVRLVGISLDITDRKRAEAAIRESEKRERERAAELEAFMDAAPVLLYLARDPECREIYGSRATYELLGLPPGSNISKSAPDGWPKYLSVKDGREIPPEKLPMQIAGATGRPVRNCELEVAFQNGARRYILGDAVPMLDTEGHPWGVVGAFLDITERKRTEEHLRQSQKLESIGLLAGGIAHDFNNLLVGIIGNASMAQEMLPRGSPAVELLDSVVKIGEQAAHLTRQMLAYAGKGRFVVQPVDLSELVPEMTELVRPSLSKRIALHLELAPDLPPIEADRGQIQQVFMNLVLNAAEAIGSHAGLISVKTAIQEAGGEGLLPELVGELRPGEKYVVLEVRDTGSGMSEATRARIFDPFFSTKFMGRGLGLAAVAGIVRSHHGAIQVESALSKGSCFRILFPASEAVLELAHAAAAQPAYRGYGTVLVVDDESIVRQVAKKALERFGYKVLLAEGGREAIDICKRHPGEITAILLDLSMPDMGGDDALPELHRIRPHAKIVVSSGYSEAEAMRTFDNRQVAGFIQKPYTSARLAEKLKTLLSESRA